VDTTRSYHKPCPEFHGLPRTFSIGTPEGNKEDWFITRRIGISWEDATNQVGRQGLSSFLIYDFQVIRGNITNSRLISSNIQANLIAFHSGGWVSGGRGREMYWYKAQAKSQELIVEASSV